MHFLLLPGGGWGGWISKQERKCVAAFQISVSPPAVGIENAAASPVYVSIALQSTVWFDLRLVRSGYRYIRAIVYDALRT